MFLFLCGCPRSGTTELTRILNSHSKIAIGMERYSTFYPKNVKAVTPAFFEEANFFADDHEDKNRVKFAKMYEGLREKWASAEVIGDKFPGLFSFYKDLSGQFAGAKFVFIYRNPADVANSWNVRAASSNGRWSIDRDYKRSVDFWNNSLKKTVKGKNEGVDILVVEYERLFADDVGEVERCLSFLGLEMEEGVFRYYKNSIKRKIDIDSARVQTMTDESLAYIETHIDKNALAEIRRFAVA